MDWKTLAPFAAGGVGGLATRGGREFLFGKKDKAKQFNMQTPEQQNLLMQLIQGLQGQGGSFGDMFGQFNPQQAADVFQQGVANPAMRNYNQNIVPGIMERFASQGQSSALNNSLANSGRDLQEYLAGQASPFMYQGMQQNQQNRLQGLGMGLGTQAFQPYVQAGHPGVVQSMLAAFAKGAGSSLGGGF